MEKFIYSNPTKIYFGKDAISNLKEELSNYGKNILLVYGGGSIVRNGIYSKVKDILHECDKNVTELSNVLPNPLYSKMMEGVKLVIDNDIDLILAVGGGSVIDCCKGIAAGVMSDSPFEDYWLNKKPLLTEFKGRKIVPIGTILTMVGTGSESNGGSVITNSDLNLKVGRVFPPVNYPKFSILDPTYTYTLSEDQMVSGIYDTLSHLLEQYFSDEEENVSDYLIEALIKALISASDKSVKDHTDYTARSNLMWIATLALNTLCGLGKKQDWVVHAIEHQISAYTNCPHGWGLACISPSYYSYIFEHDKSKFIQFALNVVGISDEVRSTLNDDEVANIGLKAIIDLFSRYGHKDLKDLGVTTDEMLISIADSIEIRPNCFVEFDNKIFRKILEESYRD